NHPRRTTRTKGCSTRRLEFAVGLLKHLSEEQLDQERVRPLLPRHCTSQSEHSPFASCIKAMPNIIRKPSGGARRPLLAQHNHQTAAAPKRAAVCKPGGLADELRFFARHEPVPLIRRSVVSLERSSGTIDRW